MARRDDPGVRAQRRAFKGIITPKQAWDVYRAGRAMKARKGKVSV